MATNSATCGELWLWCSLTRAYVARRVGTGFTAEDEDARSRCRFTYKTVLFFLRNRARLRFRILHRRSGTSRGRNGTWYTPDITRAARSIDFVTNGRTKVCRRRVPPDPDSIFENSHASASFRTVIRLFISFCHRVYLSDVNYQLAESRVGHWSINASSLVKILTNQCSWKNRRLIWPINKIDLQLKEISRGMKSGDWFDQLTVLVDNYRLLVITSDFVIISFELKMYFEIVRKCRRLLFSTASKFVK